MRDEDWTGVIFGVAGMIFALVILVVVMLVAAKFYTARAQRQDMVRLQGLVDRYEATSAATTRHQESAATDLADVRERLESIERLLREVE